MNPEFIPVKNGRLAAYSIGNGRPVIFLHGGPGDTHHYIKKMAIPLFQDFQCIFFDQRGTGLSTILNRSEKDFSLDLLFNDLLLVQSHFQAESAPLVGHSWGAMYALFACIEFPSNFRRAALLNMGPLDEEMGRETSNHLLSILTTEEKELWTKLREKRNQARDEKDLAEVLSADKEMMNLRVKSWVFNSKLRKPFFDDYFLDPPPDREVNSWVWAGAHDWFSWTRLETSTSEFWIAAGRNDSVPISQTEKIGRLAPNAKCTIFEECGHIPWLEHPNAFYSKLRLFLNGEEVGK
jgi:pimeloyl-ACP methyl ester carboxylesterase